MRFLLPFLFTAVLLGQSQPASKPKLVYVVILSRHGVRSPTVTNEALKPYAAEPWPRWSVAPGELTEHGSKLMRILGGWYREWLAQDGLVSSTGCEAAANVHVRVDVDQRTRESGRSFVQGMFPGCAIVTHTVEGPADPLFQPVLAGIVHSDPALASAAISGRIGNHPAELAPALQHAFGTLREILLGCAVDAYCPAEKQPGKQGLLALPASIAGVEGGLADIRGPVQTGATMAENLLLEYAEGMRGKDLGWGRLDETRLREIRAIHVAYADLARRTPYLATVQGSNLLLHILHSMEQAVAGKPIQGALGRPGDRMLLLVGHDANLSHVSGLLNLSWLVPGYQRDDTPPGGSLVFRLWQSPEGGYTVESLYIAQTLYQMRNAAPLTRDSAPGIARIFVPGCSVSGVRYDCDWDRFRQVVSGTADSKYVGAP